jgi:hypothetical protein
MSAVITSPVKRWPGTVTIADPQSFPQFKAWRAALAAAQAVERAGGVQEDYDAALLPGILACVESWALAGNFPDVAGGKPFPATPRLSSNRLLIWLIDTIAAVANEAEADDPK